MNSLEAVWEYREESLFPSAFGTAQRGICLLSSELFAKHFREDRVDPRWLHLGVLEFPPTGSRSSWLYVTSGGSTPWESEPEDYDQKEYSWLGVEFVLEAPTQAEWPVRVLQNVLAYHVLLCHGRYGDQPPLDYGHRLPLGGPIDGSGASPIRFLALAKPEHYPATMQLPSGRFDLLHVVGITEAERDFAKARSTEALISALKSHCAYPVTDPRRAAVACDT